MTTASKVYESSPRRRSERIRVWSGRRSLHTRVRLLVAVVTSVSVLFVVSSVVFFVYQSEQDVWRARQQEAARGATSRVEAFIREVLQHMVMVGFLESAYLADHPDRLPGLLAQNPALIEIIRLDSAGTLIDSAYNTPAPVLAHSFTVPQSSWFLAALRGEMYLSDVQLGAQDDPYLIVSVPASEGGVIAARLDMTLLWAVVQRAQFSETGRSYVVNRNGYIVAHPDQSVVKAQTVLADRPEIQAAFAHTAPGGAAVEWRDTYTNFQGDTVQGMALPILDSGWITMTEVTRSEATSTTRQAAITMTGSLVVLGLLAYLFMVIMLQFIALTPLEVVRQGAFRMGQGHLDERIPIETQDEIGTLAREFNHMADNLQQKIEETELLAQKSTEANEFKTNLISRVSHELRNPLGGVLGISEMVQLGVFGPVNEKQAEAMGQIVTSAEYLTKLVSELLEQSRLERGRVALSITEFDPRQTIEQIVALSKPKADEKGIDLITEFDPDLPATVILDQGKLEQIVANLVSNAVKFTDSGAVRVEARASRDDHWLVQVHDTGIGIPRAAQEQIFEPFRQVDESITRKYGGFGLGLSIVKHLTALMNGDIALDSAEGQGSCFTITLPYSLLGAAKTRPLEPIPHPLVEGVVLKL